jgi:2-polyprenyl-6-methoxyphenol hydroxylase-like FAD-dependent oxidoreductase
MDIVIIGAGIGGLTTALFLEKLGMNVRIYEQSSIIKPVGAGIILAHNAMQVYEHLGLKEPIINLGIPLSSINIKTAKLKKLSTIKTNYFDKKYGVVSVAIQRGLLQKFLIHKLQTTTIHLGKKVVDIMHTDKTSIVFSDNKTTTCDLVIAADGIRSTVRRVLFSETTIRPTNQICWRGLSNISLPEKFKHELNELWGNGSRFGFVEISQNQVYWYALHNSEDVVNKDNLLHYFKSYTSIVNEIITSTHVDKIFRSEIFDLQPIEAWVNGNVCLLGDAAHATTPNMGQGACQAIEDAYVLSHCLSMYPISSALDNYQTMRKNKADMIINMSRKLGGIAHIKNPLLAMGRNIAMKLTPARMNRKTSEKIYTLPQL